jgi:protein SCO1
MSGRAMNKKTYLLGSQLLLGPLLLLAACSAAPQKQPFSKAPLAGAAIGGDFTLTDQTGKPQTYAGFNGKFRIVYFGYTSCPDICRPDMQNLMAGLKTYEKAEPQLAAKIQPLFITIDPARDTPSILAQFVRAFHPRLIGLTGSESEIAATAKKFAVFYDRVPGSDSQNYVMSHSQAPYLMAPDGSPLAILPFDNPTTDANEAAPDLVAAELALWVR